MTVDKVQGMNAVLRLKFHDKKIEEECTKSLLDQCILVKPVMVLTAGHDKSNVEALDKALRHYFKR